MFRWDFDDVPVGDGGTYTMLRVGGAEVGALMAQQEQERAQGVPPHWNNYVTVEDVDASAERARSLGGTVLAEPFDVMDAGRMAVVQDPTGGVLSMWQPNRMIGAARVNEPGCLTWNDLNTRDTESAKRFYGELFGWTAEPIDAPNVDYTVWRNGDRSNGGMFGITEEMGEMPTFWMPYFAVESLDEALVRVKDGGGTVASGPMNVPTGRVAVVQDPQGAAFAMFEGELED
ncbi:MAG TPA: VOC family protein [Thermoleophilaceae bacterium]